jgi:hypothetical protein
VYLFAAPGPRALPTPPPRVLRYVQQLRLTPAVTVSLASALPQTAPPPPPIPRSAWNDLKTMGKPEAMQAYVELLASHVPDWPDPVRTAPPTPATFTNGTHAAAPSPHAATPTNGTHAAAPSPDAAAAAAPALPQTPTPVEPAHGAPSTTPDGAGAAAGEPVAVAPPAGSHVGDSVAAGAGTGSSSDDTPAVGAGAAAAVVGDAPPQSPSVSAAAAGAAATTAPPAHPGAATERLRQALEQDAQRLGEVEASLAALLRARVLVPRPSAGSAGSAGGGSPGLVSGTPSVEVLLALQRQLAEQSVRRFHPSPRRCLGDAPACAPPPLFARVLARRLR